MARPTRAREQKQSCRAEAAHAWICAIATLALSLDRRLRASTITYCVGTSPNPGSARVPFIGCCLALAKRSSRRRQRTRCWKSSDPAQTSDAIGSSAFAGRAARRRVGIADRPNGTVTARHPGGAAVSAMRLAPRSDSCRASRRLRTRRRRIRMGARPGDWVCFSLHRGEAVGSGGDSRVAPSCRLFAAQIRPALDAGRSGRAGLLLHAGRAAAGG